MVSAADLAKRQANLERIELLKAELKPLQDEVSEIEKRAAEALEASGRAVSTRGKFSLSWTMKAGRQAWKDLALKWKPANEPIPEVAQVKRLVISG